VLFAIFSALLLAVLSCGFFVVQPNVARALILFGRYRGTVREDGFYWTNPFTQRRKVSVRAHNLASEKVKVNDLIGNPIEIAAVIVWRVRDTAQAIFDVEDYLNFVNVQSEAAVRQLASTHPYDEGQADDQLVVDVTGGQRAALPIAVPVMPTPAAADTAAGNTTALGRQVAETADLRNSELFTPIGPSGLNAPSYPQVTAPDYGYFATTGAQNLVQGFVQANGDGRITVGCYLYDISARTELTRQGYVVQPRDWRRAAHRCADAIFSRLTGEGGYFDTTPESSMCRRPARRGGGSSGSRSWIMTAPTTAS
jgi:hypothetical protein